MPKPAGPGAIAAGGGIAGDTGKKASSTDGDDGGKSRDFSEEVESFSATGLDAALELLEVVNAKKDKASVGTQAANLEKHPEVCRFLISLFSTRALTKVTAISVDLR